MDHKPNVWTGEKDSELFAAFKMELNWTGPLGMLPDGEEDWKLKDRTLQQVLMACTKGEATHYVCNPNRSRSKKLGHKRPVTSIQ